MRKMKKNNGKKIDWML